MSYQYYINVKIPRGRGQSESNKYTYSINRFNEEKKTFNTFEDVELCNKKIMTKKYNYFLSKCNNTLEYIEPHNKKSMNKIYYYFLFRHNYILDKLISDYLSKLINIKHNQINDNNENNYKKNIKY